jgi:hypothetical protein
MRALNGFWQNPYVFPSVAEEHCAAWVIRPIDRALRWWYGIYEFSQHPGCVFRIARGRSQQHRRFSDGTVLSIGDPILELHFWNEHIPRPVFADADISWAVHFCHRIRRSLTALVAYLQHAEGLADIVACCGETSVFTAVEPWQYRDIAHGLGFELEIVPPAARGWPRVVRMLNHLYVWLLLRAFNPVGLQGKSFLQAIRIRGWITKKRLLECYAKPAELATAGADGRGHTSPG